MIPHEQRENAAKYFTISNLGQTTSSDYDSIKYDFEEIKYAFLEEAGIDIDEEYEYWKNEVEQMDTPHTEEWNKVIYPRLTSKSY